MGVYEAESGLTHALRCIASELADGSERGDARKSILCTAADRLDALEIVNATVREFAQHLSANVVEHASRMQQRGASNE
jgi:hypothetical protein